MPGATGATIGARAEFLTGPAARPRDPDPPIETAGGDL
jgi:hypothetical protein